LIAGIGLFCDVLGLTPTIVKLHVYGALSKVFLTRFFLIPFNHAKTTLITKEYEVSIDAFCHKDVPFRVLIKIFSFFGKLGAKIPHFWDHR